MGQATHIKLKNLFHTFEYQIVQLKQIVMKTNHNINFKNEHAIVKAQIVLISFKEDSSYIVYSPQLEVTGYGKNQLEAMKSFNYALASFLDYTVKKKTLHEELVALGWELKKGSVKNPKKINAPSWSNLIKKNHGLEELLSTHNISTQQREVAIPM